MFLTFILRPTINLMKHFILLAVFAALVSCDFEFDPMGSNNPDNPCIWYPEMISDHDTLSVPCTVTFELLNVRCGCDITGTDLNLTVLPDCRFQAQIETAGSYYISWEDNCGATDCMEMGTYSFSIF